jgi:HSP20 family protein
MAALTRRAEQPVMSLRDAMDRLFADAFTPFSAEGAGGQAARDGLPVNIYENGESYYLHIPLPGADADHFEITAVNGVLSISARQRPLAEEGWKPLWQEWTPSEFRRQLRLPVDFDPSAIKADYTNGVLTLTVPKAEHSRPKTIKVQVGK